MLAIVLATATAGAVNAESATIDATVRLQPIVVDLALDAQVARVGDTVRARATVRNLGPAKISDVSVEVRVDASAVSVRGMPVVSISKLQPGHASTVSWTLCAVRSGNVLVLVRAALGGASVESPARLLTISGQRNHGC